MQVNRESLLKCLSSVSDGLASREVVEQSSCFVFRDGTVLTYNDEVAVIADCPVSFKAAIPSRPLISILRRLTEEHVNLNWTGSVLEIRGAGRKTEVRGEDTITLPFENVEDIDGEWVKLETDFSDALSSVLDCASRDESSFSLTCVHLCPDFVEACDNFQFCRYSIRTGLAEECLIRKEPAQALIGLGVVEIGVSQSWVHFRNADGLRISCRRWVMEYDELSHLLEGSGDKITLPAGLSKAVGNAEIFSAANQEDNHVTVKLKNDKMLIVGQGNDGKHQEQKTVKYSGPAIAFTVEPRLLESITKKTNECELLSGRLKFDAGKFIYVACLGEL